MSLLCVLGGDDKITNPENEKPKDVTIKTKRLTAVSVYVFSADFYFNVCCLCGIFLYAGRQWFVLFLPLFIVNSFGDI